ncbi:ABC transporter ATP-binding protein [Acidianus sp. RZ1]|uniref:ATP-binding cassette domain-containing protein n=1 Tax=Acidianus sp. RZ1 TaxID=1540082 RepID=UPI0020A51B18|nr:ABC transporter ATP-binding protein [Acidianus sp. RZ1]
MIALKDVYAGYNKNNVVLKGVSFEMDKPSIYILLGKNGAGKTTTLRVIAGILPPIKGEIIRKGSIGYLSHSLALPQDMRVKKALLFIARLIKSSPETVEKVIDMLKLRDLENKRVVDLSQGQKKKVSLAKLFLKDFDIYLVDEPTANLDPPTASEIREMIVKLSKDKIVIYMTHNLYEAKDIGNYVILLDNGKVSVFSEVGKLKAEKYVVGIKASADLSKLLDGYYRASII